MGSSFESRLTFAYAGRFCATWGLFGLFMGAWVHSLYMYIYINKDNSSFSKVFNYFYFKAKNKLNGTVYYGERSFGYNGKIIFCGYF